MNRHPVSKTAAAVAAAVAAAFLLPLSTDGSVSAFVVCPSSSPRPSLKRVLTQKMVPDDNKIAGSFFNPVPDEPSGSENDRGEETKAQEKEKKASSTGSDSGSGGSSDAFDIDQSFAQIMARRNKKPLAATPSTIGGIPTAKASGFGKPQSQLKKKGGAGGGKPVVAQATDGKKKYVQLGKPLNDINNPEYDDQGYTLYADEKTGEKKRVFEALVEYPSLFTMKIVGANEGEFVSEMVQVVAESCEVQAEDVENSVKVNGKWISVTVKAPVKSAEMLYSLYENIDRDPRVKFKF